MKTRGLVHNSNGARRRGGFFQKRKKMGGENDGAHQIHRHLSWSVSVRVQTARAWSVRTHMAVYTVIGDLVGHDSSASIVDQDVEAVGLAGNFVGRLLGHLEVG